MNPQISSLFEGCSAIDQTRHRDEIFKELPTSRGLVLFADSAGKPIQLLCAANIRRTAKARLIADPEEILPKRKTSIADITAEIYYLNCFCDFSTSLKYYEIAKTLFPDSYTDLLAFGKCSYLKIDTSLDWPCFSITDRAVIDNNKKVFGPFYSRKSAADFLCALQDAFLLCRCPNLIAKSEKAKSCPYFQMQLCLRPCTGGTDRSGYLEQITSAIRAIENIDEQSRILKDQMRLFSEKLNFEKAQIAKKQLDALTFLTEKKYRWVTALDSLAVLHIDKGAKVKIPKQRTKVQSYSVFLTKACGIIKLGDFTIDQMPTLYDLLKENLSAPPTSFANAEELAIAAYYLYRNNPPGLWLNCKEITSAYEITKEITQKFLGTD